MFYLKIQFARISNYAHCLEHPETRLLSLLKEGGIYNISDFKVVPNPKTYRVVNTDLSLEFYYKTEVVLAEDTNDIPRFKFELTKYEDISALLWDEIHRYI